jgi:hypothetical protein
MPDTPHDDCGVSLVNLQPAVVAMIPPSPWREIPTPKQVPASPSPSPVMVVAAPTSKVDWRRRQRALLGNPLSAAITAAIYYTIGRRLRPRSASGRTWDRVRFRFLVLTGAWLYAAFTCRRNCRGRRGDFARLALGPICATGMNWAPSSSGVAWSISLCSSRLARAAGRADAKAIRRFRPDPLIGGAIVLAA